MFFLGGGFLPYVLLVMLPTIGLSLWAAYRVKSTYAKWSQVDSGISMNAFDFARYLLNSQGLTDVGIEAVPGQLTDHYDPRSKVLRVSSAVAAQSPGWAPGYADARPHLSVASVAVIAHEVATPRNIVQAIPRWRCASSLSRSRALVRLSRRGS